ncbi:MAG: glycosyltransferase [Verrucomicrobiota bacterium]
MKAQWLFWGLGLVLASVISWLYGQRVDAFDHASLLRVLYAPVVGTVVFAMTLLLLSSKAKTLVVVGIWIPSVLLRLLLMPAAPSDDVNRYLWEGKLLASGVSPYAQTADDPSLAIYEDEYWEAMNHKDQPTAYPPLVLGLFALIASVAYTPIAFKLVFVLADLLIVGALVAILRRRGLNLLYAAFYALNPLVLLAYAGEGHFDSLMVAPLVLGLWLYECGRPRWACFVATMGAGIKWMTLPLVPFLSGGRLISGGLVSVLALVAPFILWGEGALDVVSGLFQFGATRSFNGPIYDLLTIELACPRPLANALVGAVFLAMLLWRWACRKAALVDAHVRWILGALLLLSPTVHFWYLGWLLPFVALSPRMPWLVLSCSAGAYFYVWINFENGAVWGLTLGQRLCFWGPFAVAALYEVWTRQGQLFRRPKARDLEVETGTVAVVVPTFNAADSIEAALQSVRNQSVAADECIVVDGDSTDQTRTLAAAALPELEIAHSDRGRGNQIALGLERASSDWVLVLHADAQLDLESIARLKRAVGANSEIVAGAMGQYFDNPSARLVLIEWLNHARALFTRTAFGDQVQFFHRKSALEGDFIPKQPLMEDVESSWRARQYGEFLYLACACRVSGLKWGAGNWFKRVVLVFSLVGRYRLARRRGAAVAAAFSEKLYAEYYKSPS